MARHFNENKLVIASHNQGKVRKIGDLLEPFGVEVVSAGDLGLSEPVEDGSSFVANAIIKAQSAAQESGLPALADDSGLVVHALNGDPGIHSARWAGEDKNFVMAMNKIESLLDGEQDRSAHFTCALALAWPDGHYETTEGYAHGDMAWPPRGEKGFGYDPVFVPEGHDVTFAEMDPEGKHTISHRANAFNKLVAACFEKE